MSNAIKIIDHTRPDDRVTEVLRHEAAPPPRWGIFNLWEPPVVGEPPPPDDGGWAGDSTYEATVVRILAGAAPHTVTWAEFAAAGAVLLHPQSPPVVRTRARAIIAAFAGKPDSWRMAFEAVHRMSDALAALARATPSTRVALGAFELWLDAAIHAHACGMALPGRAAEWENVADCTRALVSEVGALMKQRDNIRSIDAVLAAASPEDVDRASELARRAAVTGGVGEPWSAFSLSLSLARAPLSPDPAAA